MNRQQILEYLKANPDGVTIPELQERFSLKYGELRDLFATLEKEGTVRHEGGFRYVYCRDDVPLHSSGTSFRDLGDRKRALALYGLRCDIEEESPEFKEIVRTCVLEKNVDLDLLKEKFHLGFYRMCEIVNRLNELGILDEDGNCTLTYREFFTLFDEDAFYGSDGFEIPLDRAGASADDRPTEGDELLDEIPLDVDKLWENELVDVEEDLMEDESGNLPAAAEEEDDADTELTPEEKDLEQILVVFELLQESKDPPKDRKQALRDVELCISMFRKLPAAVFRTLDRLEAARKNLADPRTTDYEDYLELLDSDEED